ncbi:LysR family transcriptional regulator [Labrenzia sp. DG1229]|uniref:LysR family transcriptional regulator n=1 Tax=Labrenzia sp. DG1229 TaxID=681847 RepID=UPI000690DFE5|nr:LysR family transcriptional regulator [Labrenzia sp. DG1229]
MTDSILADVDIKLLRVFRTIVECRGFSPAQAELNLSRSTISTHMANLETRVGFKLCSRGRAGFALTDRGRSVYEAACSMLAAIEGYHAQIEHLKERIVGEVTVGVVDNLITNSDCHLRDAIRDALAVSQDLRITLRIAPPDEIEEQLVRGQIQMAITPQFQNRKFISQRPVFSERQLLLCGRENPLFLLDEDKMTSKLVAEQQYVRRGFVSVMTPYSSHFNSPALAVSHQMEGLAFFILSGRCVGFLPEFFAEYWIERNEMRVIRPDRFCFDVPICLSRREDKQHTHAEACVYDAILCAQQSAE